MTEGAARSAVLKVTPAEPKRWLMPVRPSNRPSYCAAALTCDTRRCKDAKEFKKELTARYGHQFRAIDEAQKTFVMREMMPKDIQRDFLTKKFDESLEKLEIIINEMYRCIWECRFARCENDTE